MRRLLGAIPLRDPSFVRILLILLLVSSLFPYKFLESFLPLSVGGYNPPFRVVVSVVYNSVVVVVVSLLDLNSIALFKYFLLQQSVPMIDDCMASAYLHLREFVTCPLDLQSCKTHLRVLPQFDKVLSILALVFHCTTIP